MNELVFTILKISQAWLDSKRYFLVDRSPP